MTTLNPLRTAVRPIPATGEPRAGARTAAAALHWRVALLVLLAGTAALYLIGLASSGYANDYYAAAAQSGAGSWRAMLFGSLDPSLGITVDKPPLSLWLMSLSVRALGMSPFAVLLPQALCGIAAVALLAMTVRRVAGSAAGIAAGLLLAVTPVATMMFRYDHPDALLVLLLVGAAAAVQRGLEHGRSRWVLAAGALVGLAFLTKMLQAFLVLPAFALVWMVAAPGSVLRRAAQVLGAGVAVVAGAGWWIALVELWPASARPYVGGSSGNSALELALGYNGLQRISSGGGMGGGPGGSFSGTAGLGRLFNAQMGAEISWLIPAAIVAMVAGFALRGAAPRTDRVRAGLILWSTWLLVSGGVFSLMTGIIHPYYTVALAPAIAAVIAIGGSELWKQRQHLEARVLGATGIAVTAVWVWVLLGRTTWHPELRRVVLVAGLAAASLALGSLRSTLARGALVAATAVALLAGPTAWSLATASHASSGSMATSGPATAGGGMGGGPGGGDSASTSPELTELLRADTTSDWVAAVSGAQSAAGLELATGRSVLGIGGWSGDPYPTLAQFQQYVQDGRIHYLIAGGGVGGGPRVGNATSAIQTWVAEHYPATTVGGQTVYDLTNPAEEAP